MSQRPTQLAAGCLVWRERGGELEVLLVHRPRYRDWSWPKGKLKEGETLAECAIRETAEETGRHVILGRPLPSLSYELKGGRPKEVHYWAARRPTERDAGPIKAQGHIPRAGRGEVDKVAWVSALAALRRLTRASDAKPLRALVHAHMTGALDTRPLVIVRHSRAKTRSAWRGLEADRPLTASGKERAHALVPLLAGFGVRDIVTSPWERCVATIGPYAALTGIEPRLVDVLSETGAHKQPHLVPQLTEELLVARSASALCTHRPVLARALAPLAAYADGDVGRLLPSADPYLRTGEALIAHVARIFEAPDGAKKPNRRTQIVAIERIRPLI